MSSDTIESPFGTPHPDATPRSKSDEILSISGEPINEAYPPMAATSTSGDELSILLSQAATKPDPLLGEFSVDHPSTEPAEPTNLPDPQPAEPAPPESFDAVSMLNSLGAAIPAEAVTDFAPAEDSVPPVPIPAEASTEPANISGSFDAISGIDPAPPELPSAPTQPQSFDAFPALGPDGTFAPLAQTEVIPSPTLAMPSVGSPFQPISSDSFPALDLSAPPSVKAEAKPDEDDENDDEEYEDDDLPAGPPSWVIPLLVSWASAVTIGLLWVLFSGRKLRESDEDAFPPANTSDDPGHRADQSRKIIVAPAIAAEHLTTLGKTVVMGSLEVTPVSITSGRIGLKREIGGQKKDGGTDALRLKIRLKNVSKDTIFAPLDEAFLRERERGSLDSVIETSENEHIEMYPLAVLSEWSIDGQEFKELQPNESFTTDIVSVADTSDKRSAQMTWKLRLRTGMNETDSLGVRFNESDIKRGR